MNQPASPTSSLDTPRPRRWMVLARVGVLAFAALITVFFVASIAPYLAHVTTPCAEHGPCVDDQLPTSEIANLVSHGISLAFYAAFLLTLQCVYVLVTLGVSLLLVWRRPNDGFALFTALTLLAWTSFVVTAPSVLADMNLAWSVVGTIAAAVAYPSFTIFFFLFPSGRFASREFRWLAIALTLLTCAFIVGAMITGGRFPLATYAVLFALWFGSIIWAQVHRYRHVSTPVQRQQTQWVVYGVSVALFGFVALLCLQVLSGSVQAPTPLFAGLYYPFELLVPLSIGIAILHSGLYDIDLLINRTLVYGSLSAVLAGVYVVGVAGTQAVIGHVGGIGGKAWAQEPIVIVATTLVVAALFQPLRRRIQMTIGRRFYRQKYNAAQAVAAFSAVQRSEVDLARISGRLVGIVEETMQPAHVSLWLHPLQPFDAVHEQTAQDGATRGGHSSDDKAAV